MLRRTCCDCERCRERTAPGRWVGLTNQDLCALAEWHEMAKALYSPLEEHDDYLAGLIEAELARRGAA